MHQAEKLKKENENEDVFSTIPEEVIENVLSYLDNQSKRRFSQTSTWIRDVVLRFGKVKFYLTDAAALLFYNDEENIRSRLAGRSISLRLKERADVIDLSCLENVQYVHLWMCHNVVDVSPLRNCKYVYLNSCSRVRDISSLGNVNELRISEAIYTAPFERMLVDFSYLGNVQDLLLDCCDNLSSADLLHFGKIPNIKLWRCPNITSVSCLANCQSLELYNCERITDVSSLARVPLLKIQYCKGIKTWGSSILPVSKYLGGIYKYGVVQFVGYFIFH